MKRFRSNWTAAKERHYVFRFHVLTHNKPTHTTRTSNGLVKDMMKVTRMKMTRKWPELHTQDWTQLSLKQKRATD